MRVSENTTLEFDSSAAVRFVPPPAPAADEIDLASAAGNSDAPPGGACHACGAPARIDILEGYANGMPVRRAFCLTCALASVQTPSRRPPRVRLATLAAVAGSVVLVVGLFGDYLIPAGNAGFGWHQRLGAVIGILVGLFGLLLRAEVVTMAGAFLFGVSLTADWFGLTHGPGIGWKQQWMIGAGLIVLTAAVVIRARHRLWATLSRFFRSASAVDSSPAGQLATDQIATY